MKKVEVKLIAARLTLEDVEAIDRLAKYWGITKSDVVRMAIKEFIRNHEVKV